MNNDHPYKILIVDDDTFLLDMYAFKFSQRNFEVHIAGDGLQAIKKIKHHLYNRTQLKIRYKRKINSHQSYKKQLKMQIHGKI